MLLKKLGLAALLALAVVPASAQEKTVVRLGITPGPHAQIWEFVKPVAAQKGIDLKLVEFSNYILPNEALNAGEIDANSFQHQPYLDNQVKGRGYKIVSVAKNLTFPLGVYSKKYKAWGDLPEGARLTIPNDPTNGARALLLLEKNGAIKLKSGAGPLPTVFDIAENPKKLKITEIDAAMSPRALDDVDAAAINGNYASTAGLDAAKDALLREDATGPYANILVVREADKDKPWVKTLREAYETPETKAFIEKTFHGAIVPAW